MPRFLALEVKARVRELYERTPLTHARIAAATGVGASTVSVLAQKEGWTRHPEARVAARLEAGRREAILRMREAGVPARAIAAAAGCHARTVGRVAAPECRAAAFGSDAAAEAGFAPAPPIPQHLAELHAALTSPGLRKGEAAALLMRCATALGAEALARQDLAVERTGQVLARLAARVATLPEDEPAGADAAQPEPAQFDDTNAGLEELARRLEAFAAREAAAAAAAAAADGARQDEGGPVRNAHIL